MDILISYYAQGLLPGIAQLNGNYGIRAFQILAPPDLQCFQKVVNPIFNVEMFLKE